MTLDELVGTKTKAPKMSPAACAALFAKAQEAGLAAAAKHTPTPMVVSQHANPLNDASPVKQAWLVPSGVCGFAWVQIRPANSSFANWMKKNTNARPDSYLGGIAMSVREYGQSMELKEKYAEAFAAVLKEAGISAYANSRMD